MANRKNTIADFWSNVDKSGECWIWTGGSRAHNGYGIFVLEGHSRRAHRIAWELAVGPIPAGLCVLHRCDVPACVRPEHLRVDTQLANIEDRDRKGRQARGDDHWTRTRPELIPRGDRHGSKTHPERIPRGEQSGRYTKPERTARGDRNGSRTHPERLKRGDDHPLRINPELAKRGEQNGNSKLTEESVRLIRSRFREGCPMKTLAADAGVCIRTVWLIVKRQTWKHC